MLCSSASCRSEYFIDSTRLHAETMKEITVVDVKLSGSNSEQLIDDKQYFIKLLTVTKS